MSGPVSVVGELDGDQPAGVLGPAAFRGSYGSAPSGACGAGGCSSALPAVQRLQRAGSLQPSSLVSRADTRPQAWGSAPGALWSGFRPASGWAGPA
jgi:hypothetical protein